MLDEHAGLAASSGGASSTHTIFGNVGSFWSGNNGLCTIGYSNGAFRLEVVGASPSSSLVIEVSTNLKDWTPLVTNSTPTPALQFTDPTAGSHSRRFYRAREIP